ncbi:glycosyltransferase [Glaciihabitans sp. UYNi722]|uniref:glycosyltransferase n=1 Tax=Glaciihabitans sp. UYNi722 TaxID=3156344 RepID=UPI0033955D2C
MTTAVSPIVVTVAMLTFQRPTELARAVFPTLKQVLEVNKSPSTAATVELLIVDNDPTGSARGYVESLGFAAVRYVVEPEPGITAGRNRALREAEASDLLVFIDDDEVPRAGWLSPLIEMWRRTGAAAVRGQVVSLFDVEPDPWVVAGEFFGRPPMTTGDSLAVTATNNLLLDLQQVRSFDLHFDDRLGLSGGEDNLFTQQLTTNGGRIVACSESVVDEFVPASRSTRRWVLTRARRGGNTASVIELILAPKGARRSMVRARAAIGGGFRVLGGSVRYLGGLALRSNRHQARGLRAANRGIGMVTASLGVVVQEYARKK